MNISISGAQLDACIYPPELRHGQNLAFFFSTFPLQTAAPLDIGTNWSVVDSIERFLFFFVEGAFRYNIEYFAVSVNA